MLNQDTINLIQNLSKGNKDFDDNVKAYLTFGHLFENNVAVTLANTYVISGKPALNADAMAGVVRRYKDHEGVKICPSKTSSIRRVILDYKIARSICDREGISG